MIVLDASAMVAMLTGEDDAENLADRMVAGEPRFTSPLAIFETAAALMRKEGYDMAEARELIDRFLEVASVRIAPIGAAESELALLAFDRFGKGRHSASLNLGDCFAYATAKALGARLLFKGEDFPLTDIPAA
jgi:ribonuclease VapC